MASATTLLPEQQQQPAAGGAAPANGGSSGSIGPFFAVMSVIIVLAIISCVLGRVWTGNGTPLDSLKHRECLGWSGGMKRQRWRGRNMVGEVDQVGAKVMAVDEDGNTDVKHARDVEDPPLPQTQPQPQPQP